MKKTRNGRSNTACSIIEWAPVDKQEHNSDPNANQNGEDRVGNSTVTRLAASETKFATRIKTTAARNMCNDGDIVGMVC